MFIENSQKRSFALFGRDQLEPASRATCRPARGTCHNEKNHSLPPRKQLPLMLRTLVCLLNLFLVCCGAKFGRTPTARPTSWSSWPTTWAAAIWPCTTAGSRHRASNGWPNRGCYSPTSHTNSSVCSPTRAAFLTGRYQQRVRHC